MVASSKRRVLTIGEAMIEMAPARPDTYRRGFAGDTFNTAWHMAQLLGPLADVGFFTKIGTDKFSDAFATELMEDGLNPTVVLRDADRQMGLYVIELEGVERSFHYWRKDSAARGLADDPSAVREALSGVELVHISGITLAILTDCARDILIKELSVARQNGTRISFDPNVRQRLWNCPSQARDAISRMLEFTDIALPSFDDEATLWGDTSPVATVKRIKNFGASEVIVKNGSEPVVFTVGDWTGEVPTPTAGIVRDTTGAGDAFNAGYLASRLLGRTCEESISTGQQVSGVVIGTLGARATREIVQSMGASLRRIP